jgi:hypothetical protein
MGFRAAKRRAAADFAAQPQRSARGLVQPRLVLKAERVLETPVPLRLHWMPLVVDNGRKLRLSLLNPNDQDKRSTTAARQAR